MMKDGTRRVELRCYIPLPYLQTTAGVMSLFVLACPVLLVLTRTVVSGSMHPVSRVPGEDVHEADQSQRL
jgi:hypothetical protein